LNRKGNHQLNCALRRIAVTQGRVHAPARAFLARKQAESKSRREALRCLKRHLTRVVFKLLRSIASRSHPESEISPHQKGKDNWIQLLKQRSVRRRDLT
jgi:transposase